MSVAVLCWNEEHKLRTVVLNVIDEAQRAGFDVDIIVVNDGSTDGTAREIGRLELEYPFVRGLHNPINVGMGESFKKAVDVAKFDRITLLPGDNAVTIYSMRNIFKYWNAAEVIVAYTVNTETRTMFRYCLSTLFSMIYGLTFGLHIRYMNGTPVFPVARLRQLKLHGGYSVLSEINVKLARQGMTFMEISGYLNAKEQMSRVLRPKILIQEVISYLRLVFEVLVWNRDIYGHKPTRIIPTDE
jgi:glycosyltransferase involved in cell wall biosynthesis